MRSSGLITFALGFIPVYCNLSAVASGTRRAGEGRPGGTQGCEGRKRGKGMGETERCGERWAEGEREKGREERKKKGRERRKRREEIEKREDGIGGEGRGEGRRQRGSRRRGVTVRGEQNRLPHHHFPASESTSGLGVPGS